MAAKTALFGLSVSVMIICRVEFCLSVVYIYSYEWIFCGEIAPLLASLLWVVASLRTLVSWRFEVLSLVMSVGGYRLCVCDGIGCLGRIGVRVSLGVFGCVDCTRCRWR